MGSNSRFAEPIQFDVEEAFTFGVTNGKYGGYSVPIKLDPLGPHVERLRSIAAEHGATVKFYGNESSTIYIRCDQLTGKQTEELLAKGIMIVDVKFEVSGTYKRKDGATDLRINLTRLRKVRVAEKIKAPAPED